jgi:hypothetical protein
MDPRRVLTWHVHGNYLWYLAHAGHDFFLPVRPGRPQDYAGRAPGRDWPDDVHEVPADDVSGLDLDCVLFQHRRNWEVDQHEILTPEQRDLPRIFLEHDPPREDPTDTRHPVDDPGVLIVHVTPFNRLMWDTGAVPTTVIEHGVVVPAGVRYRGDVERGIVVVNHLGRRGRRLGSDVFERVRAAGIPLDLAGMGSEELGGLGELFSRRLAEAVAARRFFFNPIRYTSLGLAVCEAMMVGAPVVGLATTEMAAAVRNGVDGVVDTDVDRLIEAMRRLLDDPAEARRLGEGARARAQERFGIERFAADWERVIDDVVANRCVAV